MSFRLQMLSCPFPSPLLLELTAGIMIFVACSLISEIEDTHFA